MAAVRELSPASEFELFTDVPRWFFENSLGHDVEVHAGGTDFGLVQTDALREDLQATVDALQAHIPFADAELDDLARRLETLGVDRVICDIAPIGLAVARRADLPSILVENFTWDWIYRHYSGDVPELGTIADELAEIFDSADQRFQTEPYCHRRENAVQIPPVSRRPRLSRRETRRRLDVPEDVPLAMVTMGGIEWDYSDLERRLRSKDRDDWWLLVAGGADELRRTDRAIFLPHHSDFYHPDLIHAVDGVVGKLGYSTLAEIAAAGLPFGYVPRPGFAESPILEDWVQTHLPHLRIEAESFVTGEWLDHVEALLRVPRRTEPFAEGAHEIARRLVAAE